MKRNNVTAFMSIAGGRVAVILVSTLVTPLLTRNMTQAQYGAYGVIMAIFGLLMILASSGINSGVRKYLAEKRDADNWTSNVFGFYFRVAFVLAVVPAVLLAGVAYTGVITELEMFGPAYVPYFYLLAVLTLAAQFREYVRRALMGLELEHVSEPIKVLHKVAFGVFAVSLVVLAPPDAKVMGVLVGEILASSLAAVVAFYFIQQRVSLSGVVGGVPADFPKRELINFNSLTVVYIFLLTSMYHVDMLMVQGFVNSQTAGIYKGALVIVGFLWLVPRSVQSVMIQSASGHWANGNVEKINEMASQATRYTLLFTLLLALGLGALAPTFVPLYLGDKYAAAVLPVILLLPGTLGFAVARPIFAISHAKGELKVVIAATGAAATLNFVLNYLLIPPEGFFGLGMLGAAIATTIGYASLPLFHAIGARHIGFQPFEDARLGSITLTGVLAGIPIVFLALVFGDSLLGLLVVPPVGLLLYGVFALLTGAIDLDEVLSVLVAMPAPIGPRARSLRGRVRDASSPLAALSLGSARSYFFRIVVVVAVISFVAGFSVAIGLEQPEVDVASNATSTPTQTPLPTPEPTGMGTASPSATATPSPTDTANGTPTTAPTPTAEGTPSPTPTPGGTPSSTPTGSGTPTASSTPTPTASSTPSPTATPTPAPTPTHSATPSPTASPSPTPSPTATTNTSTNATSSATTALVVPVRSWLGSVVALAGALTQAVARMLSL
jgi:O-antigen/teichoic acid export membrane protein